MQKKRNILLFGILGVLLALIFIVELNGNRNNTLKVNKEIFKLNAQQEINEVVLTGPDFTNRFNFLDGRWQLNDSLYLDQNMRDVFFSVVSQIEIRRSTLSNEVDSIANYLRKSGVNVRISFGGEKIQSYQVGGNKEDEISWMMGSDEIPYIVHIPGYQSYVAGIFDVPAEDWRSRFILDVNFALLRKISLVYPEEKDLLELEYQNNFFTIPNIQADSLKIADFLDQLAYLQADVFINKAELDDKSRELIMNGAIYSNLILEMVNGKKHIITFYKSTPEDQNTLVKLADGSLARISSQRLDLLFKKPGEFE